MGPGGCYPSDLGLSFCIEFQHAAQEEGKEGRSRQGIGRSQGGEVAHELDVRAAEVGVRGLWVGEGGTPQGHRGTFLLSSPMAFIP